MSTDDQLIEALSNAAQKTLKRTVLPGEKTRLITFFNEASGSTYSRALDAIRKLGDLTEAQLLKEAASDDANRVMNDLKRIADQWKK